MNEKQVDQSRSLDNEKEHNGGSERSHAGELMCSICGQGVELNTICPYCAAQPEPWLPGVHGHAMTVDELALATCEAVGPASPLPAALLPAAELRNEDIDVPPVANAPDAAAQLTDSSGYSLDEETVLVRAVLEHPNAHALVTTDDVEYDADVPFDPLAQEANGPGMVEAGEYLVWKCPTCIGMVNSVYNNVCAGRGCNTPRPFPQPAPSLVPRSYVDATSLEQAFAALPGLEKPEMTIKNLRVIIRKCGDSDAVSARQCAALLDTICAGGQRLEDVVEMGVKALQSVCLNAANLSVVDSAGGFEVLLSVMQAHPTHALITGCQIIQRITVKDNTLYGNNCATDDLIVFQISSGMVDRFILALLTAMNTCCCCTDNATTAEQACVSILHLSLNSISMDFIVDSGGIPAVSAIIRAHADNAAVVYSGCGALQDLLATVVSKNKQYADEHGCIPLLYSALRTHNSNMDVAFRACYALRNLCNSKPAAACILETGGVELIVSTMTAHNSLGAVQYAGCAAMAMMLEHFKDEGGARIVRSGAMPVILTAMQAYYNSVDISVHGCAVFACTSRLEIGRTNIIGSGGILVIIDAMIEHCKRADVISAACVALYNLAYEDGDGATRIISSGGLQAVIAALEVHADSADVVGQCCSVLARLTSTNENLIAMLEAKGIPILLSAMDKHSSSVKVTLCSCAVLQQFRHIENIYALLDSHQIDCRRISTAMLNALRTYKADGEIAKCAIAVLGALFSSKVTLKSFAWFPEAIVDVTRKETIELFLEIGELHTYDAELSALAKLMAKLFLAKRSPQPKSRWWKMLILLSGLILLYRCIIIVYYMLLCVL